MNRFVILAFVSTFLFSFTPALSFAEEEVYGWELMTLEERAEFRETMRSLKTPEERQKFREDHHMLMEERAKERGVTLKGDPSDMGRGMGKKRGMGMGGMRGGKY